MLFFFHKKPPTLGNTDCFKSLEVPLGLISPLVIELITDFNMVYSIPYRSVKSSNFYAILVLKLLGFDGISSKPFIP